MRQHPDASILIRAIGRCLVRAAPWTGSAYRATSVTYANRDDILTGQGAKVNGGRWNPPGTCATVYTSLTPETALAEYLANHRYYGFPDSEAMPYVMVGLDITLQRVLDLTDGSVRKALGVSEARMLDPGWRRTRRHESLTQAIGRIVFAAELEGIIVPSSAARGAVNLVVFPGNLVPPGSWVKVVNRDKLPPPKALED